MAICSNLFRAAAALALVLAAAGVSGQNDTGGSDPAGGQAGAAGEPPNSATFWRDGDPGERLMLTGRVVDMSGMPIAGAVVDVWQADGAGYYRPDAYRGTIMTNAAGEYALRTAVPGNYRGAKHIHMMVSHGGHGTVTARIVFKGDPNLPEWEQDGAVVLEEARVKDHVVYVGTFDVVMPGP